VGAGMILSAVANEAVDTDEKLRVYTKAEIELNAYIRSNFPEWEAKEIF